MLLQRPHSPVLPRPTFSCLRHPLQLPLLDLPELHRLCVPVMSIDLQSVPLFSRVHQLRRQLLPAERELLNGLSQWVLPHLGIPTLRKLSQWQYRALPDLCHTEYLFKLSVPLPLPTFLQDLCGQLQHGPDSPQRHLLQLRLPLRHLHNDYF